MAIRFMRSLAMVMAIVGMALIANSTSYAQTGGGGTGNDPATGGVEIDANGVLSSRALFGGNRALDQQRAEAAHASMNKDLREKSNIRWISLTRMEREAERLLAAGQPIPAEMKYLAGLNRITHVFYFPETKDIVIGGPAEGFFVNSQNRVVGLQSGQATLHLQDLIVALRAFSPNGDQARIISCSIDPTQEGLQRMKEAYAQVQHQFQPGDAQGVVNLFQNALGMQTVTIKGISPNTHFARTMVDADYHMKLIGIGLEQPPVRITSFIEKATPTSVAKSSLQRWFFQPDYDCIAVSQDEQGMEMIGGGVQLVGEDESIANDGSRKGTGGMNRASKTFCSSFTKMYNALSQEAPLYAELRNCIDMSIVAAFIQEMDFYGQAEWKMATFGDEAKMPVEIYDAPRHVAPAINAVWKGRYFMTPIGGGVSIRPREALTADRMKVDEQGKITELKKTVTLANLAENQWWWD